MMAGRLFSYLLELSPGALVQSCARLVEYVPVLALGGDPRQQPAVLAVPRAFFALDSSGRALGLFGPRLAVELPQTVAVRVDPASWRALETIANPLRGVEGEGHSAFLGEGTPGDASLAMTTAFAVGSRVIGAAERWAGHIVEWGQGGRLSIVPYATVSDAPRAGYSREERRVLLGALGRISQSSGLQGFTGRPYAWRSDVVELLVDTARDPDAVAHETGHAVVSALKPGWEAGVALVLHEAISDMFAVLVSLEDPAVLARCLRETGCDLRRYNEAAGLYEGIGQALHRYADNDPSNDDERCLRTVLALVEMDDCALDPESVDLPPVCAAGGRVGDPHFASLVVSGLLYGVFCRVYEEKRAASVSPFRAALDAQCVIGTLMLASLPFVGEHRVSLRDYALALLRTDRDAFGGHYRVALREALDARGVLPATEDVELELRRRDADLPPFVLPPEVRNPGEVRAWLETLESTQLRLARSFLGSPAALVRHASRFPFVEEAEAQDVEVWSDLTGRDGNRVVRVLCRVAHERLPPPSQAETLSPEGAPQGGQPGFREVYASLVFDLRGRLIALNADRPWP